MHLRRGLSLLFLGYLVVAATSLFFHSRTLDNPFRGEHWSLVSILNQETSFWDKVKNISLFSCKASRGVKGLKRHQPLGFFITSFSYGFFGTQFHWHNLASWILHLICATMVVLILKRVGKGPLLRWCCFTFVLFSFVAFEVFEWAFFSYIQCQTILILLCAYWWLLWQESGKIRFAHLIGITLSLASLIYESALLLFFAFTILAPVSKQGIPRLKAAAVLVGYFAGTVFVYYGFYEALGGGARFAITFPPVWFLAIVSWFATLFVNSIGFAPQNVNIIAVSHYPNILQGVALNAFNIGITVLIVIFFYLLYRNTRSHVSGYSALQKKMVLLSVTILVLHISLISLMVLSSLHGKAPAFLSLKYLLNQARYYYIGISLGVIVVACSFPTLDLTVERKPIVAWQHVIGMILFFFVVSGNVYNTVRYSSKLAPFYTPTKIALNSIGEFCRQDSECIAKVFYGNWRNYRIATPEKYRPFVYNAVGCL